MARGRGGRPRDFQETNIPTRRVISVEANRATSKLSCRRGIVHAGPRFSIGAIPAQGNRDNNRRLLVQAAEQNLTISCPMPR